MAATKAPTRGMGTFFKECEHPHSKWSKCPHEYKIRHRSAASTGLLAPAPRWLAGPRADSDKVVAGRLVPATEECERPRGPKEAALTH